MRDTAARRPTHRVGLWLGYLPLALAGALFIGMVWIAPSDVPGGAGDNRDVRTVGEGQTASGWGETVNACTDRETQVDFEYAPPCFEFSGDNGGETSRGVSADTINISYRMTADPHLLKLLADYAGIQFDETPEDLARTMEGLVDYFNANYQFYGRKLKMERVEGSGSLIEEFTGGGHDSATNDALKMAEEVKAFADISANSQPYADALSDNEVVNIGAPYMSREWFSERAPYAWSQLPNCSNAAEAATDIGGRAILQRPARYAGGDLTDRQRKVGLIAPNNREYQQCADAGLKILEEQGMGVDYRTEYVIDIATIPDQAANILAELKNDEITTVALGLDPLMAASLATAAEQQNYKPEWLVLGVGFNDLDLVGQMIQQDSGDQWSRAFGGSPWAPQQEFGTSEGYQAYKSAREDEPSQLVDLLYYQMLQLALGIQMAGPELTPENFETGMLAYPETSGIAGTWDYTPENRTGIIDARIFWWQPDAPSSFNGQPGTYLDTGERFKLGEIPEGDLEVFR